MKIAEIIKKLQSENIVIFITAYTEYAIDAFQFSVFRFVPKGSIDRQFATALKAAIESIILRGISFLIYIILNN